MNEVSTDAVWLVKTGERILGPYSREEIVEKLHSKELVVIDEVTLPGRRWKYLREEAEFSAVIEEIRRGSHGRGEDTEVATSVTIETTAADTISDTITMQEPTNTSPEVPDWVEGASQNIQEAQVVSEKSSIPRQNAASYAVRQYGVSSDRTVQQNLRSSSKVGWAAAGAIIVICGLFVYRFLSAPKEVPKEDDFTHYIREANHAYRLGEYQQALRPLRLAHELRSTEPEVSVKLAASILRVENQTGLVKSMMRDLLAFAHDGVYKKQAHNLIGLALLTDNDVDEAKTAFENALAIDAEFAPALYNLGCVLFLQKQFDKAAVYFQKSIVREGSPAMGYLMLLRTNLQAGLATKKASYFDSAEITMKQIWDRFADFRQEASVIGAYLATLRNDNQEVAINVRRALLADPFLTNEHIHDANYGIELLGWNHLLQMCEETAKFDGKAHYNKALLAICLDKVGKGAEAKKILKEVFDSIPTDSLVQSMKAYLAWTSGQEDEAYGILKGTTGGNYEVANILLGRYCLKIQDYACAKKEFERVRLTLGNLVALTGLATLSLKEGQVGDAGPKVERARSLSPNYRPLLVLDEKMDAIADAKKDN